MSVLSSPSSLEMEHGSQTTDLNSASTAVAAASYLLSLISCFIKINVTDGNEVKTLMKSDLRFLSVFPLLCFLNRMGNESI